MMYNELPDPPYVKFKIEIFFEGMNSNLHNIFMNEIRAFKVKKGRRKFRNQCMCELQGSDDYYTCSNKMLVIPPDS